VQTTWMSWLLIQAALKASMKSTRFSKYDMIAE
jgi:hypothetical protein